MLEINDEKYLSNCTLLLYFMLNIVHIIYGLLWILYTIINKIYYLYKCFHHIQHNAIAICVHLNKDKVLNFSRMSAPGPYISKMLQYAGVSKDSIK